EVTKAGGEGRARYLLADGLLAAVSEQLGWSDVEKVKRFKGSELEGVIAAHPLYDRDSLLILGEHVTLDAGTGCVHTAPGHGVEDYEVGLRYGLEVLAPVDAQGRFTAEAGPYAGLTLTEGNKVIVDDLKAKVALLSVESIEHSYPHCWRCKQPVAFRATEQWF